MKFHHSLESQDKSYTIYHSDLNDGYEYLTMFAKPADFALSWSVNTTIPVQQYRGEYKKYTMAYIVYEKVGLALTLTLMLTGLAM